MISANVIDIRENHPAMFVNPPTDVGNWDYYRLLLGVIYLDDLITWTHWQPRSPTVWVCMVYHCVPKCPGWAECPPHDLAISVWCSILCLYLYNNVSGANTMICSNHNLVLRTSVYKECIKDDIHIDTYITVIKWCLINMEMSVAYSYAR